VLLSGNGTTMSSLLFASRLPDAPYEIVLVASNDPDARGLAIAKAEGIATFAHPHKGLERTAHEAVIEQALKDAGAEYVALAGYMRVLTGDFVERWAGRMLNTHPSLLPKFKGLHTHQRAIEADESEGGCTVHIVTEELDAGPMLGQIAVRILPDDTPETLGARVLMAEYQLYPRCLADYVGRPYRADWLLAKATELALALPEVEVRESHGSPGFHTGGKSGKFFAHFNDQHHGTEHIALLVKTDGPDELAALIDRDPDTYFRPAYYGAAGWVGVILNRPGVDWDHVGEWLARSWRSVAPKRLTGLMSAADQF
jgi:phosphoribosylglycinamide formyltransferase-1